MGRDKGEWVKGKEPALWSLSPVAAASWPSQHSCLCLFVPQTVRYFTVAALGILETAGDRACIVPAQCE